MSDGFEVSPPALDQLADSFESGRQALRDCADPMVSAAGAIDTGDAALDAETAGLVRGVNNLFGRIADGLGNVGAAVLAAADNYRDGDSSAADGYRQLLPDGPDTTSEA